MSLPHPELEFSLWLLRLSYRSPHKPADLHPETMVPELSFQRLVKEEYREQFRSPL